MKIFDGQDTFFKVKKSLNCRGRILDLSTPAIMGILNFTPDSFYDGGKISDIDSVLKKAEEMLEKGADILDVGGQSTRPGAKRIDVEEEWKRIEDPIRIILKKFPHTIISVDTFYSEIAKRAIDEGASIVNDISGGDFDERMNESVCSMQIPYVVMHHKGTPEQMQKNPHYDNVVIEVMKYLVKKVTALRKSGLNDIIIDPGFGFGKNTEHNYTLLKNLRLFNAIDCPLLVGISRKSMITKVLDVKSEIALNGTTVLNTIALMNGASILRVHDVKEAVEARKIFEHYRNT